MYCPLCARALQTVERQGVEIDYCQGCGGMWLDQGELDQLVEAEAMAALRRGQEALTASRHDREYDQVTGPGVYGIGNNFSVASSSVSRR